jgi:hypothetical protein
MDLGTRDGLRMDGDWGEHEMIGTYDFRGAVYAGRLAKENISFGEAGLTVGANYLGIQYDKELAYESDYGNLITPNEPLLINPNIASLDVKGNLTPKIYLMADFALSWDDTTTYYSRSRLDSSSTGTSTPAFGAYLKLQDKHWEPITLEVLYLPKDFYSPYGMSNPSRYLAFRRDEFSVGAGTFRYTPNLMGANVKLEPEFNRGRFDVQYGIHRQVEKGNDIVNFKYDLNGRAVWESMNSWTKFKPYFGADSGSGGTARYVERAALFGNVKLRQDYQRGGIKGGTWEMWETFAPYTNAEDAQNNNVPQHVKWNSSLALDMGYDIGHWFNTDRNIMLALYTALSGVSTSFQPVAWTDSYDHDMLMWNLYVQSEPAIAITPTLHGLLTMGFEMYRAEQAYVVRSAMVGNTGTSSTANGYNSLWPKFNTFTYAPINILETAIGFGLDWDFSARAGVHFRYKWMTHSDETVSENNWKGHYVQAETKVWF